MRISKTVLLGSVAALLAACGGNSAGNGGGGNGGGGNGGGGGDQTNETLTNLVVSETFSTASGTIEGTVTQGGAVSGASSAQSGLGSDVTLAYDADNDSYTVNIDQSGVSANTTFRPGDAVDSNDPDTIAAYSRNGEDFLLFIPGNPTKTLTYVTYGGWLRSDNSGSNIDFETSFFVFGIQTPAGDMPSTGTASYDAAVDGYWMDGQGVHVLSGDGALTADFGAGNIDGEFALNGTNIQTDANRAFDLFTGSASISGNTFSGTLDGRDTDYAGDWDGGFFGPEADEVGGSFRVIDGDNQAVGVFVGNQP